MHTLKTIAIAIGAIILIGGSTALTIAALWGKPRRRGNKKHIWDESTEDV